MRKINNFTKKIIIFVFMTVSIIFVATNTFASEDNWQIFNNSQIQQKFSGYLKPLNPQNLTSSVGQVCGNAIVTIYWDSGANPNLSYNVANSILRNFTLSNVSYRIEKENNGHKANVYIDDSSFDSSGRKNLTSGGIFTDTSVAWNEIDKYRIYAIDTNFHLESDPAEVTVEVKKARSDYESSLNGLNLKIKPHPDVNKIEITWDRQIIENQKYEYRIQRKTDGTSDGVIKTIKQDEISSNITSDGQRMQYIDANLTRGKYYYYKVELYWSGTETQIPDQPEQSCNTDIATPQPPQPLSTTAVDWNPEVLSIISSNELPTNSQLTANIPESQVALIPPVTARNSDVPTNDVVAMRVDLSNDQTNNSNQTSDTNNPTANYTVSIVNDDGSVANSYTDQVSSGENIYLPPIEDANTRAVVTFDNSSTSLVMDANEYNNLAQDNADVNQAGTINVRIDDSTSPTPEQAIQQDNDSQVTEQAQLAQANPAYIQSTQAEQTAKAEIADLTKQAKDLEYKANDPATADQAARDLRNQVTELNSQIRAKEQAANIQQNQILDPAFAAKSFMTSEMKQSLEQTRNLDQTSQQIINNDQSKLDQIQEDQNNQLKSLQAEFKVQDNPELKDAIIHLQDPTAIKETKPELTQTLTDYDIREAQILDQSAKEQAPIIDEMNKELTKTQDQMDSFQDNPTAGFIDSMIELPQQTIEDLKNTYQEVKNLIINDIVKPSTDLFSQIFTNKVHAQDNFKVSQDQATVKDTNPAIILYQLSTDQTPQSLTNNTINQLSQDQGDTIIIEAHNFVNTRNYQLYLDNTFQSEGKVLGDGFAVKLTLPKTLKPGSHTITLLGDATNEQAKTTFTLTKNSYLLQRYWAMGIMVGVIILLIFMIILKVKMKRKSLAV